MVISWSENYGHLIGFGLCGSPCFRIFRDPCVFLATTSRRDTRYTYCIIFPGIALTAFYFIDFSLKIWTALLSFSILFFLWQRYVMLWLYGKSQFDSDACWTKLGSVKSCKLLFLLQSCWSLGAPERLCWGWLIWDKRCHDWSSSCQV